MRNLLLLAGGVVVLLLALRVIAWLLVRPAVETLDFRGPVRAVEVTVGSGEVTVRGGDRSGARVRRTTRNRLRRPRLSEHVDEGTLRLQASRGAVHYEVDVPRRAAVVIRSGSASATVIGVNGPVELRAGAGSFEGRALKAPEMTATTDGGSIRMSFDAAPAELDVTTEDGHVDLALPPGPYDVHTEGDAKVGVPTSDGAPCRVRARARSVRIHAR